MCTITDKAPELQIADKDITVYKDVYIVKSNIIDRIFKKREKYRFVSNTRRFIYEQNKVYTTILDDFLCSKHYSYYESGRGFYSFKYPVSANVKCIIPKGAHYYVAEDIVNDKIIYHSDKIKIIGLIKRWG